MTEETQLQKLARLDQLLMDGGIEHFTAREVTTMRKTRDKSVAIPPEKWWPRILPTLRLAELIRAGMGHALSVGNGYRPPDYNKAVGGARGSTHVKFMALDLDLPMDKRSRENQEKYYQVVGEIFIDLGREYRMGLGLYRPWRGTRVHIDTARRRYWKRKYVKPLLESLR